MKLFLAASAIALLAIPAVAQMAPPPINKSVTRAEAEAKVRERLGAMDANKDGTVSPEEAKAFHQARMKEHNAEMFAAMDTDKNGQISRAEFDAFHSEGRGMPMMHMEHREGGAGMAGGKPMRREMRMMHMGDGPMMAWMGDGKGIVISDAVKRTLDRFDAADTNKDGVVTSEERKAAREDMRNHWMKARS